MRTYLIISLVMIIMGIFQALLAGIYSPSTSHPSLTSTHFIPHSVGHNKPGLDYTISVDSDSRVRFQYAAEGGISKELVIPDMSADTINEIIAYVSKHLDDDSGIPEPLLALYHHGESLRDKVKVDPMGALLLHLRNTSEDIGPDFGAGLTFEPNLSIEDKQLLIDLKLRLKDSAYLLMLLEDDRDVIIRRHVSQVQQHADHHITSDRLRQFFNADLPAGVHGDPNRSASDICVKTQVYENPLNALLYNLHNIRDDNGGPDVGGGLTFYDDLNEQDTQLLLDVINCKNSGRFHGSNSMVDVGLRHTKSDRLKQFIDADLPDYLRDETALSCIRLTRFYQSDLQPEFREYPVQVPHSTQLP